MSHRRTVATCLLAAAFAAGLTACKPAPGVPVALPVPSAPSAPSGSVSPSHQPSRQPSSRPSVTKTAAPVPSTTTTAPAKAPARDFPVATLHLELSRGADRPLPTTVWYPSEGAGPFPVIIWSHGIHSVPENFSALLTQWARAGFVVAAPAFPYTKQGTAHFDLGDLANQPADVSVVLTEVLKRNTRDGSPLQGRLDVHHIGASGHSGGGITTAHLFSHDRDARLTAGIVESGMQLQPAPFTGTPAKLLFIHGALDPTVSYQAGLAAYNAVPWPKALITMPQGDHNIVFATGIPAATTDFWRWSLYGDAAAKARISGEATGAGYRYDDRS